jgi:hypothetical protein
MTTVSNLQFDDALPIGTEQTASNSIAGRVFGDWDSRRSLKKPQTRLITAIVLIGFASLGSAQGIDDLDLQLHGYATQAVLYTNHNSWNTTDSDNVSAAWTEAVVNLTVQPQARLHIGIQARYYMLGDLGNQIMLAVIRKRIFPVIGRQGLCDLA